MNVYARARVCVIFIEYFRIYIFNRVLGLEELFYVRFRLKLVTLGCVE